jgi:hypothetical protein
VSIANKKIWIDIEEPKAGIMFYQMIKWFQKEKCHLLITARDFDSTFSIMDDTGFSYRKIGRHGGDTLQGKMKAFIERLDLLFTEITQFKPDFFVTFGSVEGSRLAMGLQIPSIGFSDEPRSIFVSKQLFACIDRLITPACIPIEDYLNLGAKVDRIIRYNGIDEIAWLSHYEPNPAVLTSFKVEKGKFVLIRSEPSFADYFMHQMKQDETLIGKFFPPLFDKHPEFTYLILVRTSKQESWLCEQLKAYLGNPNVVITRYLPHIVDLCFYAKLVISGGGTIVRESSLLGVPSIEYFQGKSAPQEEFLIQNGFPMEHIKEPDQIVKRAFEILSACDSLNRYSDEFKLKIKRFEDPCKICFETVKKVMK